MEGAMAGCWFAAFEPTGWFAKLAEGSLEMWDD